MSAEGDVRRSGDQKHKPHVDISLVLLQTLYILKRRPNSLHTAANGSADVTQRSEILTDPVFTTAHKHLLLFIGPDRSQSYLHARYHTKPSSMEWKNSVVFFSFSLLNPSVYSSRTYTEEENTPKQK